jgi:hypothetical protein
MLRINHITRTIGPQAPSAGRERASKKGDDALRE